MSNRAQEVLYDSEATLRLLDSELGTLGAVDDVRGVRSALGALPLILEQANKEIVSILENLRKNKTQLQSAAVERLQHTHSKLEEVNSATESAATGILDSLDRAQGFLDTLDADDADKTSKASELRDSMRNELFSITEALQFQDITSQQIRYAANVLVELEDKLMSVLHLIDITGIEEARAALHGTPKGTYDPNATTRDREVRQHVADEVFTPESPGA
jgi:chemotaxis regulatin CheY-phosphate phosphatase CheZ